MKMQQFEGKSKTNMDDQTHRLESPDEGDEEISTMSLREQPLEQDDYTKEAYDSYLGAELFIPSGDQFIGVTGDVVPVCGTIAS